MRPSPAPLTWRHLRGGSAGGGVTCLSGTGIHFHVFVKPSLRGGGCPPATPGLGDGRGCPPAETARGESEVLERRAKAGRRDRRASCGARGPAARYAAGMPLAGAPIRAAGRPHRAPGPVGRSRAAAPGWDRGGTDPHCRCTRGAQGLTLLCPGCGVEEADRSASSGDGGDPRWAVASPPALVVAFT